MEKTSNVPHEEGWHTVHRGNDGIVAKWAEVASTVWGRNVITEVATVAYPPNNLVILVKWAMKDKPITSTWTLRDQSCKPFKLGPLLKGFIGGIISTPKYSINRFLSITVHCPNKCWSCCSYVTWQQKRYPRDEVIVFRWRLQNY